MLRTFLTICALTVFGMTSLSATEQEVQKDRASKECNLAGCRGCKKKNKSTEEAEECNLAGCRGCKKKNKHRLANSSKEEVLVGCGGKKHKNKKDKKASPSKGEVLVGCGQNDEDQNPANLLACGKCK